MTPVKYIEEVPETPISRDEALTDEESKTGGLVLTDAWVRTKSSKAALRVQKHRDKQSSNGCRQLNVVIPDTERDKFKEWARLASEGKPYGPASQISETSFSPQNDPQLETLRSLKGWRRVVARLIGLLG